MRSEFDDRVRVILFRFMNGQITLTEAVAQIGEEADFHHFIQTDHERLNVETS